MARIGSTLLVLALLGGTAVAFAVTERLKVQPSPITRVRIENKVFSPRHGGVSIGFGLRKSDRLTLLLIDGAGEAVRELVPGHRVRRGFHSWAWDGRDDAGRPLQDGTYRPRVQLEDARRTIVLPNPIQLDSTPPQITVLDVGRTAITPNGDRRSDSLVIRYRVDEPARALLYADGMLGQRRKQRQLEGTLRWYGRVGGKRLDAGRYELAVAAEDIVNNRSRPVPAGTVRISYPRESE